MKKLIPTIIFILLATPCFGAAVPRSETDVKLIYYLEKMMAEQMTQVNSSISNLEKQLEVRLKYLAEALLVSDKVLEQKFVRVDRFMEKTSGYDSSLAALSNRMTIVETQAKVTSDIASAEAVKMVMWLGLFFTAVQIGINIMNRKDREKPKTKEIQYVQRNGDNRPVEPR